MSEIHDEPPKLPDTSQTNPSKTESKIDQIISYVAITIINRAGSIGSYLRGISSFCQTKISSFTASIVNQLTKKRSSKVAPEPKPEPPKEETSAPPEKPPPPVNVHQEPIADTTSQTPDAQTDIPVTTEKAAPPPKPSTKSDPEFNPTPAATSEISPAESLSQKEEPLVEPEKSFPSIKETQATNKSQLEKLKTLETGVAKALGSLATGAGDPKGAKKTQANMEALGSQIMKEFEEKATPQKMMEEVKSAWEQMKGDLDTALQEDYGGFQNWMMKHGNRYGGEIHHKFSSIYLSEEKEDARLNRHIQQVYGQPNQDTMVFQDQYQEFIHVGVAALELDPPWPAGMVVLYKHVVQTLERDTAYTFDDLQSHIEKEIDALSTNKEAFALYSKILTEDANRAIVQPLNAIRQALNLQDVVLAKLDGVIGNIKKQFPIISKLTPISKLNPTEIVLWTLKNPIKGGRAVKFAVSTISKNAGGNPPPLSDENPQAFVDSVMELLAKNAGLDDSAPSLSDEVSKHSLEVMKGLQIGILRMFDFKETARGKEAFGDKVHKAWEEQLENADVDAPSTGCDVEMMKRFFSGLASQSQTSQES